MSCIKSITTNTKITLPELWGAATLTCDINVHLELVNYMQTNNKFNKF